MDQFKKDLEFSEKIDDQFVGPWLKSHNVEKLKIAPKSNNGDYEIKDKHGNLSTLEVKAERQHRSTLALEHWSDKNVREGWLRTSESDWLAYFVGVYTKEPFVIRVKMQELKAWFAEVESFYKDRELSPKVNRKQRNQTSFYSVPIIDIKKNVPSFRRENLSHIIW